MLNKKLHILGIRGIPAHHGGFETFAENLSPYLVGKNWHVTVYCQKDYDEQTDITYDTWHNIQRVHIPVKKYGFFTSMIFDWKAIKLAARSKGVCLILGYNTALFSLWLRLNKKTIVTNMDGMEWKRSCWPWYGRLWFYINEWLAIWFSHHLIADNPHIKKHLKSRWVRDSKITMIPYGARSVENAEKARVSDIIGQDKTPYALVVARPVPENNILEIVKAWSQENRGCRLFVLGNLKQENSYHRKILAYQSTEIIYPGAVYEADKIDALRYHAEFYIHGHSVGGTNPSLLEAMGAGNATIAHDNPYNRWVLSDDGALYFKEQDELLRAIYSLLNDSHKRNALKDKSKLRHQERFQWHRILKKYKDILENFC